MGKGDKKTRKGKISMGSYGITRPKSVKKNKTEVAGGQLKEEPKTRKAGPKAKK